MNNKIDLKQRFINGLKTYKISIKDIEESKWKYCGGNHGDNHINYFKQCFNDRKFPDEKKECICGHKIKYNYYITDGTEIIIIGSRCKNKFIPKKGRTCSICGEPHRNRKVNHCNMCKADKNGLYRSRNSPHCDMCLMSFKHGFCNTRLL